MSRTLRVVAVWFGLGALVASGCQPRTLEAADVLARLDDIRQARAAALVAAGGPADVTADEARRLRGVWVPAAPGNARAFVELNGAGGRIFLWTSGVAGAPLVRDGEALVALTGEGTMPVVPTTEGLEIGGTPFVRSARHRAEAGPPPAPTGDWVALLGHYHLDADGDRSGIGDGMDRAILVHERGGTPALEVDGTVLVFGVSAAEGIALEPNVLGIDLVRFATGDDGVVTLLVGDTRWRRAAVGAEEGDTFRIEPVAPIGRLREEALASSPPDEPSGLREPELVELVSLEPDLELDIRYAGTDNFMGSAFYQQARAFLQRPAAEAVVEAHRRLAARGLGLLIHDGYRPWHVTRMFWDATPEALREFVADPAQGSRHNRGAAVDLTLLDLDTGRPVRMPGGYDEFSPRSYPHYPGGTDRQRWYRDLLRDAMEDVGFDVYEAEWWHFDHRDWRSYPILDLTFEELVSGGTLEP